MNFALSYRFGPRNFDFLVKSSEKDEKENDNNRSCYSCGGEEELNSIFFLVIVFRSFFMEVADSSRSDQYYGLRKMF